MTSYAIVTPNSTTNNTKAGSHQGPAFVVAADPLTPSFRDLLEENRRLRRECGRLWLKAFAPKERQEFLLTRLDRVAELEALDERGDINDYMSRVMATFDESMNDIRRPVEDYVIAKAA